MQPWLTGRSLQVSWSHFFHTKGEGTSGEKIHYTLRQAMTSTAPVPSHVMKRQFLAPLKEQFWCVLGLPVYFQGPFKSARHCYDTIISGIFLKYTERKVGNRRHYRLFRTERTSYKEVISSYQIMQLPTALPRYPPSRMEGTPAFQTQTLFLTCFSCLH